MVRDTPSAVSAADIDGTPLDPQPEVDFRDFFDNGPVALHVVGSDGTILHANKAELHLLGYSREDYVGSHIADFHVDQDIVDGILERLGRGESVEAVPARLRAHDGSIKSVEVTSSPHLLDGKFAHSRCDFSWNEDPS